jgi:hypothetical protein
MFQPAAQVELVMTAAVGFGLAAVVGGILPTWAVQNGWVCGVEGPAQWKGEVCDRPAASIGPVLHPRMGLERSSAACCAVHARPRHALCRNRTAPLLLPLPTSYARGYVVSCRP